MACTSEPVPVVMRIDWPNAQEEGIALSAPIIHVFTK
jgi:hypothetical protein